MLDIQKKMPQKSNKIAFPLFLFAVFIEQALVATQGLSMYDEGAFLASYELFFPYPQCAEYFFMYYNALVLGGIWEHFFGQFFYYGFRIANILIILATITVCYLILRKHVKHWIFYLGMIIHLLASHYGVVILHHNWISALLIILSVYFMLKALNEPTECTRKAYLAITIAGVITGINIFTRIANIALIGMFLTLIPYYYYNQNAKVTLKLLLWGLAGTIIGIILVLTFMYAMGHLHIFFHNIHDLFLMASDDGSGHNLYFLLHTYAYNYYRMLRMIIFWYPYHHIFILYALSTIAALIAFCKYRGNKQLIYILTAALLMAHLHPLGSFAGIQQLGDNSLWLLIPCSIQILVTFTRGFSKYKKTGYAFLTCLLALYVFMEVKVLSYSCDFDLGPRTEKTYRIDSKKANVFTQKTYQTELNILIHELNKHVKPGDVLFCWNNLPLIHYITSTRPFLDCVWTSCIPESNIHHAYLRAESQHNKMPVVVLSKGISHDFTTYDPDWNNIHASETIDHRNKKIREFLSFVKRHNYHIVWQNHLFQILISQ